MSKITWHDPNYSRLEHDIRRLEQEISYFQAVLTTDQDHLANLENRFSSSNPHLIREALLQLNAPLIDDAFLEEVMDAYLRHVDHGTLGYDIQNFRTRVATTRARLAECGSQLSQTKTQLRRYKGSPTKELTTEELRARLRGIPHLNVELCDIGYHGSDPAIVLVYEDIQLTPKEFSYSTSTNTLPSEFGGLQIPTLSIGGFIIHIDLTTARIHVQTLATNHTPIFQWASLPSPHPHALDGFPCFGNRTGDISEMILAGEWDFAALFLYEFLSHAIHTDSAGRGWHTGWRRLAEADLRKQGFREPNVTRLVQDTDGNTYVIEGTVITPNGLTLEGISLWDSQAHHRKIPVEIGPFQAWQDGLLVPPEYDNSTILARANVTPSPS